MVISAQAAASTTAKAAPATSLVEATVAVASAVLAFDRPADRVLSEFFRGRRELGHADRGFIAETIYSVLRRKRFLEHIAGRATPRALVLAAIVRLGGVRPTELRPALGAAELEWIYTLRDAARAFDPVTALPGVALDLPDWLVELLATEYGPAELAALADGLARPAPLDLRVNIVKSSRDTAQAALAASGIASQPCVYAPYGLRVAGKPALSQQTLMRDGTIEVQDEGSQLVCHLVAPRRGEMVVDFCAGAGGKTLALGAMMRSSGRVYAFDVAEKRLDKFKPRLARSGLSNVHPQWIDGERDPRIGRLAGKIDRVLIDAPCSGLGTLRRNPDLKWRQQPADIVELAVKQASIVQQAARLVKIGGRVVYATCSVLAAENEAVVADFMTANPGFALLDANTVLAAQQIVVADMPGPYLKLLPHRHGTDGFFAAVLERRA